MYIEEVAKSEGCGQDATADHAPSDEIPQVHPLSQMAAVKHPFFVTSSAKRLLIRHQDKICKFNLNWHSLCYFFTISYVLPQIVKHRLKN